MVDHTIIRQVPNVGHTWSLKVSANKKKKYRDCARLKETKETLRPSATCELAIKDIEGTAEDIKIHRAVLLCQPIDENELCH